MTTPVSYIMTPQPVCVDPNTSLLVAAAMMRDHHIGDVLVVDDGRLAGIVTDRDLVVRGVADGRATGVATVGQLMAPSTECVDIDTPGSEALFKMRELGVRRLPVCDRADRPVGIVSLGDLAEAHAPNSIMAGISAAAPET